MPHFPDKRQQILQAHAWLVHGVVMAYHRPELRPEIEKALKFSADNGWTELVGAIRLILAGTRDRTVLSRLDEEDTVIAEAILQGLQDPSALPDPRFEPDPALAAPGLAAAIHAAARGNSKALQIVAGMAEQTSKVPGDMSRLGAAIRPLINGERDPDRLSKGMTAQGKQLVLMIVEELGRLDTH